VSLPMFAKQFKSILTISTILTKIEFRVWTTSSAAQKVIIT
jgi:hypothetical protein